MKFLIDTSATSLAAKTQQYPDFVAGQLLTPLTAYTNAGGTFAIDNGAFSGFDAAKFSRLLAREEANKDRCLFVTVPDVVGNARRTLEVFRWRHKFAPHWPVGLVVQDGQEDLDIPWGELDAIFVGGRDPWKDSQASLDIVKTAKTLGVHVHIGRVNTYKRFRLFHDAGADTCDGSGIAMYDHMLEAIVREMTGTPAPTLFNTNPDRFECEYCG